MTRFLLLVIQVFTCVVLAVPAPADDPTKKLTAEERKVLEAKWEELSIAGIKQYGAGKYPDAITKFEESLKVARRLYNATEFPDGNANLATSLNNLALLYQALGNLGDAEPFLKDALEMRKRLFTGQDHPNLASSLNNLASLYRDQGKLNEAESLFKDTLEMYRRLTVAFARDKTEEETALSQDPLNTVAADSLGLLLGGNAIDGGIRSGQRRSNQVVEVFSGTADVCFRACLPECVVGLGFRNSPIRSRRFASRR